MPPGLIYAAKNGAIRSSWVEDIEVNTHDVFVTERYQDGAIMT